MLKLLRAAFIPCVFLRGIEKYEETTWMQFSFTLQLGMPRKIAAVRNSCSSDEKSVWVLHFFSTELEEWHYNQFSIPAHLATIFIEIRRNMELDCRICIWWWLQNRWLFTQVVRRNSREEGKKMQFETLRQVCNSVLSHFHGVFSSPNILQNDLFAQTLDNAR